MPRKPKTPEIKIHSRAVEMRRTIDLLPYAKNARTHSPEQISTLAKIIADSGFTNPVIIEADGTLIAGHGRVQAAHTLGMTELPCVVVSGLSEAQIKALRISDNQSGLLSGWDLDLLAEEVQALKDISFNIDLTGLMSGDLLNLFLPREQGETDPDAEWQGMPEFDQPNANATRNIIVHFKSEADVQAFGKLIGQSLTEKTKYIWYPYQEPMDSEAKRYGE